MTSGAKAEGRFGKQDFVYNHRRTSITARRRDIDILPHERRNDLMPLRDWTTACPSCPIKSHCTPAKHRIMRWEQCAYSRSRAAAARREPEGHAPNGARRSSTPSIKARMGAMHFLMKTLPRVSGEMALHVLAYNLTRAINIVGSRLLIGAIRA
jgi:hypothetical protein